MLRHVLAPALALSLAACGGLLTPDLGSGELAGRVRNASAAAYLYPYGRPELAVKPAADGSYVLARLPVEVRSLVVVDGAPGSWRAALVPVTVSSATHTVAPEVDAAAMPAAGRVGVVAQLDGGSESSTVRFTAVGTDRADVPAAAAGTATVLDPLPAGTFELVASARGFAPVRAAISVVAGATTAHDVHLRVDAGGQAPGCAAPGAACRTGFVCDRATGGCHECLADLDCAGSTTGRTSCVNRACVATGPVVAPALCDACRADADCASGVCSARGYCTRACAAAADCPAALVCASDGARAVCLAPEGCESAREKAREEFGSDCFYDRACSEELTGAVCVGARPAAEHPVPGYCTGRCDPARPDDCALTPGYVCNPASRVCERR
jgi:hypothetical protein